MDIRKLIYIHKITNYSIEEKLGISHLCNVHTHGLERYTGYNLCMNIDLPDAEHGYILNTVAAIIVSEGGINLERVHCVDDEDGHTIFRFYLRPVVCYHELCYQIMLADKKGILPSEPECDPYYMAQNLYCCEIKLRCYRWIYYKGEFYEISDLR